MITLFFISLILIIYCYFGYPFSIWILSKFFNKTINKAEITPSVSVVLSVHNEEDVIEAKIINLLSLDYPKEKITFHLGSDASTDNTNSIIKNFKDDRINLYAFDIQRGKMFTINNIVKNITSDCIVFTDARQMFEKDAIKQLVANFNDSKIGCVSGELIFRSEDGATSKGINLYWTYEKFIRNCESKIHSMLGATGAIYAIRRDLYSEVPENVVLDDVFIPLQIIKKGYRAIFDKEAIAYDKVADSPREEHRRKARTLFGNYQAFGIFKSMFIPILSPIAFQFFSHKLLRVIAPFLMIIVFITNIFLIDTLLFKSIFISQIIFYLMAMIGYLARYKNYGMLKSVSRICYVPYVFCLLNFSALAGFFRYITNKQQVTWQKAREK